MATSLPLSPPNHAESLVTAAPHLPEQTRRALGHHEARIAVAIAEVAFPKGSHHEAGGQPTVRRLENLLNDIPPRFAAGYRSLLWAAEASSIPVYGRPFSWLSVAERTTFLERVAYSNLHPVRNFARAVLLPLRVAHFDSVAFFRQMDLRYGFPPPQSEPAERWASQITEGSEVHEDLELECEVVVIGTGAGGAACAYELASRNRAVVMLEEGKYYRRRDFNGRPSWAYRTMYRDFALTVAIGNVGMPVWAGRAVGGSTVINSGTCYRTPERTFERWREKYGLHDISSQSLDPYFKRVEMALSVAPGEERYLGGVAKVVARGADRLGLHHGPISRNAPGCDGAGVCCFGCPTGAKRSTDVSYVPDALKRGAQLITEAKVDTILVTGNRARAVSAVLPTGKRVTIKADAVVVAAGALMTPLLLQRNELCGESGWLGRNLSIHPASKVVALFDEEIDMTRGIPQSYAIDEFADDGLMFEGASVPPDVLAMGMWSVGKPLMDLMESYRKLALFGMMLQDHSRGRVLPGPDGSPLIFYNLTQADTQRMQRGLATLCDMFLAAGARRVFPFIDGQYEVSSQADLQRLRTRRLRPGDFEITSFHPLGTCRMGADPRRSCVGPDHQAHHVRGLYVVDGSALPSSLGANPQLTIMAMALRAGEIIDSQLA